MASGKRKSMKESVETEDLIRLVQEKPCLWDRSVVNYRDRVEKDRAWVEIYRQIEPDYDTLTADMKNLIGLQITKKWYNVRDSYVKSKKIQAQRQKPYVHSKLLSFLDRVYFEKNCDLSKGEDNEDTEEQWLNEVFLVDDEEELEPEAKRQKIHFLADKEKERGYNIIADKEKEECQIDGNANNIFNVLANLINREDDEDRSFFRSIMPAVKKLDEDTKLEFRVKVMNILKKLLNNDKQSNVKCEFIEASDTE